MIKKYFFLKVNILINICLVHTYIDLIININFCKRSKIDFFYIYYVFI